MHHQATGLQFPVFVGLGPVQHHNVFKTPMLMKRDPAAGLKTDKSSRRPVLTITVKPMNMDPRIEQLPIERTRRVEQFVKVLKNQ